MPSNAYLIDFHFIENLPYEILTLSHFGFKYCSVTWDHEIRGPPVQLNDPKNFEL